MFTSAQLGRGSGQTAEKQTLARRAALEPTPFRPVVPGQTAFTRRYVRRSAPLRAAAHSPLLFGYVVGKRGLARAPRTQRNTAAIWDTTISRIQDVTIIRPRAQLISTSA